MTPMEEAKVYLAEMAAHTNCCGVPIIRKLVAELERWQAGAALGIPGPLTIHPIAPDAAKR